MQVHSPPPPPGLSRAKATAFKAAAVALPFIVILIVEAALRLVGVGEVRREPFQPIPGRAAHVAVDPDYGGMFFRGFRPNVAFDPLSATKRADALRVVALGGSTTAGFPYHWYYGFPARLEDRLATALPGQRVEVANLGMTATNSYTIWALANAVVAQQPDAVVIYSGHNEFYGAYGTAGTQGWTGTSVALKRLLIRASKWALVAGVSGWIDGGDTPASDRRTMMARVVRDASVAPGSETFRAGVEQFEANLRDVLRRFERAEIPVYLATLTSNLADQAPLGDDPAAATAFDRGRTGMRIGDGEAARTEFLEAKEADGLRFRAPEAINSVVRHLAAEFPNVTLVDIQERFRTASPGGLEGASLFTDHLHPNARGYALMADAFFEAIRPSLAALRHASASAGTAAAVGPADADSADDRSAGVGPVDFPPDIDPIEERIAGLQIAILTSGYPFRKDRTPAEAEAAARAVTDSMAESGHYADSLALKSVLDGMPMANILDAAVRHAVAAADTLAALRLYRALLYWQPFNEPLMERAVGYAIESPSYDAETAALARYAAIHAEGAFSLNALGAIALRQGDLDRAGELLEAVERIDPTSPEMLFNRARLLVMQGDTLGARAYFERYQASARAD